MNVVLKVEAGKASADSPSLPATTLEQKIEFESLR